LQEKRHDRPLDQFVLTVQALDATCAFYGRVLGFRRVDVEGNSSAWYSVDKSSPPSRSHVPTEGRQPDPGSGDFFLMTERPIGVLLKHLQSSGVEIEVGPIERDGAEGAMTSVYFRAPHGNLVDISCY
jgi:catechol 2,3-dioxygenase-like lactoylglutathione lyase family enzyme